MSDFERNQGAAIVADQGRLYGIVGDPRQVSGFGWARCARKKGK